MMIFTCIFLDVNRFLIDYGLTKLAHNKSGYLGQITTKIKNRFCSGRPLTARANGMSRKK
jgi:hypothetical protein